MLDFSRGRIQVLSWMFALTFGGCLSAHAQRVSLGVMGGGYAGPDFQYRFQSNPYTWPLISESDKGGYIVGVTVSAKIQERLSLTLDALYKPLSYRDAATYYEGSLVGYAPNTVVTWQFPVLANYQFGSGNWRPFVEGGPSFRSSGNLNSARPSSVGATVGLGVAFPWKKFSIEPRVRYTRWKADSSRADVRTHSDQIEFLAAFRYQPDSSFRPLGKRFSVGAVMGAYLSGRTTTYSYNYTEPVGGYTVSSEGSLGPRRFAIGPTLEYSFTDRISVEASAISRGLHHTTRTRVTRDEGNTSDRTDRSTWSAPWEFPVLAKYRFATGTIRPFVAGGPAFRLPKGSSNPDLSKVGIGAGIGVEIPVYRFKVSPQIRYTRWAANGLYSDSNIPRDQMYFLVGIAF